MASSLIPENVPRSPETKPIRVFKFDIVGTGQVLSLNKPVNGVVQSISYKCKSLTTDTTYDISIIDLDGNIRNDNTGITHNSSQHLNLYNDTTTKAFLAYDMIKVQVDFPTTSQTLVAGDLEVFLETTKN